MKQYMKIFLTFLLMILLMICLTGCGSSSSTYSSDYTYKSSNPADYDSKGNYKPVESMTQQEIKQELIDIMEDSIY